MKKHSLRKSARGQDCMIRIPGVCNFNPETTVLCHLNGGGMGMKKNDLFASFGCSDCHDVIDHRIITDIGYTQIEVMHRQGVERTQQWWLDNGYIGVLK